MTGFRVSRSGQYGLDGAESDLMTFGKVMGGGFPAAAFGGRAELMQSLAPVGGVYQAGTLSGKPGGHSRRPDRTPARHARGLYTGRPGRGGPPRRGGAALSTAGVPHVVQHSGNLFSVFFVGEDVTAVPDYATASTQRTDRYAAFFHAMLDQGIYLPPSAYEGWFLGAAHDDSALDRIVSALPARGGGSAGVGRTAWPGNGRSCIWCGTARCTTPPACCTADCPTTTCPISAGRWHRWSPTTCARGHRASALLTVGAGPGDHGADRRGAWACRCPSTAG